MSKLKVNSRYSTSSWCLFLSQKFFVVRFLLFSFSGYLIPKGWCVLASFSSVHMDETNYENPYEFDPWRWKVTRFVIVHIIYINEIKIDRFVYCSILTVPFFLQKIGNAANGNIFTPFGGGQRLCPGLELSRLEISIFLHHLVTTYR